jgi:hypothetical protein
VRKSLGKDGNWHMARAGEKRKQACMFCLRHIKERKKLGRHSHKRLDNNKMDLKEIGWGGSAA